MRVGGGRSSSRGLLGSLDARLLTLLGLLVAALVLRCARLEQRPMHNDEAVNAVKFGQLLEKGVYRYDPNEHHGPTLYYATWPLARLAGSTSFSQLTESQLRLVPALFGVGLIILLPLLSDGLGRRAVLWAALFIAISPAMVFYSVYYIHEMLLLFFSLLALAGGWRYWRSRKVIWIVVAGAALGLMHATKETFLINIIAASLALGCNQLWNRWLDASGLPVRVPRMKMAHAVIGVTAWLGVAALFFSSFFTHASGPLDSIRTYLPWMARAGGESPHIQPWNFYFQRLIFFHAGKGPIWSEALIIVLAVVGGASGFARRGAADANASFVRFLTLYTLALTAAYTLIAYKTPWCLLNFWLGTVLLAGVGALVVVHTTKRQWARCAAGILVLAGAAQLAAQAWQASGVYAADWRNPYAYAQTSPNVLELVQKIEALSRAHPDHQNMVIKVIATEGDFWPLPWYLRRFTKVGYWEQIPEDPYAPVMLVSAGFHAALDEKKTHLMAGYFEFRPAVFFELYVEVELWKEFLKRR